MNTNTYIAFINNLERISRPGIITPNSFIRRHHFNDEFFYLCLLFCFSMIGQASTSSEVRFEEFANDPSSGLIYSRQPTPRLVKARNEVFSAGPVSNRSGLFPIKWAGAPGIAILDYDGDGDQDIYVTNGPDTPNSLFQNQLVDTGVFAFTDVAISAGISAESQDSTGVCYSDIDNDGDQDLYVLGNNEANRLFENQGDGTFTDITNVSGVKGSHSGSTTCSIGDVNDDGLLDIVVSNTFDWSTTVAFTIEPYALNQHNELFINAGKNHFNDVSATSGIQTLDFPLESAAPPGSAGISWSVAMADYDMDGDVDIIVADDQADIRPTIFGGTDRGFIRIWENNGNGVFTDVTGKRNMFRIGAWMAFAFADFNCDGSLDIFASNLGDYFIPFIGAPYKVGEQSSKWFLGQNTKVLTDPGLGDLKATPFGWGNAAMDYDNDGDTDIVFHGGMDVGIFFDASNPGVILENEGCSASFSYDHQASSDTNHSRRNVQGLATGDLNNDGFSDIVTVSSFDMPEPSPLILAPSAGSDFDGTALYAPVWRPSPEQPGKFIPADGFKFSKGTLSVEINNAETQNNWVKVSLLGTSGITNKGKVNRDGIGAIVKFTPSRGKTVIQPVLGGASYASQHSLDLIFGLGAKKHGMIEVLWPGGVRNRLYGVPSSKHILFPEIPCSFDADWKNTYEYISCVRSSLLELQRNGVISHREKNQFFSSAIRALYFKEKAIFSQKE